MISRLLAFLLLLLPAAAFAQNGAPLSSGYLSVSGNQFLDGSGNPQRLSCAQFTGSPNDGSMQNIRNQGTFNCVVIDWRDMGLTAVSPPPTGCNTFAQIDACVANATAAGLKVILSHRGNEIPTTSTSPCWSRQANGLPFDNGGNSGNDDGCNDGHNVTYLQFIQNTVSLLQRYNNNSTVIGYQLHHEPLVRGTYTGQANTNSGGTNQPICWNCGGGDTDWLCIAQEVGNDVAIVNPNAILFVPGPINRTGTLLNGQVFTSGSGLMDLSAAGVSPVGGSGGSGPTPPAPAAAAGYKVRTYGPAVTLGVNWFAHDSSGNGLSQNADGSVNISGGVGNNFNAHMVSGLASGSTVNPGAAFGNGGYFEATLSFTGTPPTDCCTGLDGWPAWWGASIEENFPGGHAGGSLFQNVETDFFEVENTTPSNSKWEFGMIDWYDGGCISGNTGFCPGVGISPDAPVANNFTWNQPHKYGWLWVPATATSQGSAKVFVDGVQTGPTYTWSQYNGGQFPIGAPGGTSPLFSALDVQHQQLLLGTGSANPMTVYSVEVWQKDNTNNLGTTSSTSGGGTSGPSVAKVAYAVDLYPNNVSSVTPDSGATAITNWNTFFGYLEKNNAAPVMIMETGCSCDGTNSNLTDDQNFMNTFTPYANGTAANGPTFTGRNVPMSTNWYAWGNLTSNPNGTLNSDGSLKSGQLTYWSTLLFATPPAVSTTWNPNDQLGNTLSGSNLVATINGGVTTAAVRTTSSKSSGKVCFEVVASTITTTWEGGLTNAAWALSDPGGFGQDFNGIGVAMNWDLPGGSGLAVVIGGNIVSQSADSTGDSNGAAVTMCEDFDAQLFWVTTPRMRALGNTWNNSASASPATGTGGLSTAGLTCPCFVTYHDTSATSVGTLNATGPFAVSTPAGFSAWDTTTASTTGRPFIILGLNEDHHIFADIPRSIH